MGSTNLDHWLPGLSSENPLPLSLSDPLASLWLGNRSTVAAHFDYPANIACCVAGRRQFTLFPPEQIENLYIGPWDLTPAGQPVSLVDIKEPDLAQFPLFAQALESASVAELAPGDAIYIPSLWWHQVEALSAVNGLVNFWWTQQPRFLALPWTPSVTPCFHLSNCPPHSARHGVHCLITMSFLRMRPTAPIGPITGKTGPVTWATPLRGSCVLS